MAKMPEIKVSIKDEKIIKKFEEELGKKIEEIEEREKNIVLEKIAFSLFATYYYKHSFFYEQDDCLNKACFLDINVMWQLGKTKNKLKKFFSLAEIVFDMDLDNNKKVDNNDNN